MTTAAPLRWAGIPGVKYPAPTQPRATLPAGCPPYVASLPKLAPWVHATGLPLAEALLRPIPQENAATHQNFTSSHSTQTTAHHEHNQQ